MVVNELIEAVEQKLVEVPCNHCKNSCGRECSQHCANFCLEYSSGKIPNYNNCARLRWQYILRYFWSHYREIEYLLDAQKSNIHGYIRNENHKYQIESIGGGPGSDLLAASQWIYAYQKTFPVDELRIWHLDSVDDWLDSLNLLFSQCWQDRNDDSTKAKRLKGNAIDHCVKSETNIVIASYIMSELFLIHKQEKTMEWLVNILTNTTSTPRVVIINDRPESGLIDLVKATVSRLEIQSNNFYYYRFDNVNSEGMVNHLNKHIDCHIPNEKQARYKTKTTCKSFQAAIYV